VRAVRSRTAPRVFLACLSVVVLGCRGGTRENAPAATSAAAVPSAAASGDVPKAALFAVDEVGPSVRDRRVDVSGPDAEKAVEEAARQASPDRGIVTVRASRSAELRWIGALVRGTGRAGVEEVDVVTPSARGDVRVPLKISPLGQVPMQEARCGAQLTVRSDGTGDLQYLEKSVAQLPTGADASVMSHAFDELGARMKGCESAVWMLAGQKGAPWGPAFDAGNAASERPKGVSRFVMVL
jgi:hypothetical protein